MAISASKIATLVQKALVTTGGLRITCDYVSVVPGIYDPATNTIASTTTTVSNLQCVASKPNENEVDWSPADIVTQKLVIAALDLPFDPKGSDYVTIGGVDWEVKRVVGVPGKSLWLVYIQES